MSDCDIGTFSEVESPENTTGARHTEQSRSYDATYSYEGPMEDTLVGSNPLLQGLGLDFQSPAQDLPSLLQLIGGYERAVGRAYLHQQSLKKHLPQQAAIDFSLDNEHIPRGLEDYRGEAAVLPALSTSTTPLTEQGHFPWSSPTLLHSPPTWQYPAETGMHNDVSSVSHREDYWASSPSLTNPSTFNHMALGLDYSMQTASMAMHSEYLESRSLSLQPEVEKRSKELASFEGHYVNDFEDSAIGTSESSEVENSSVTSRSPLRRPLIRAQTDSVVPILQADDVVVKSWTKELDERLRAEVQLQQNAGMVPLQWTKIARRIGKRSGVQCQARWAEVLDEKIRKGRWADSEDNMLRHLYKRHGGQWSKIATEMVTRTQRQCRSRWLQMNGAASI